MKGPANRRQAALNRMVSRLDRRIATLKGRSRKLSWVRLGLFLAIAAIVTLLTVGVSERAGAWALAIGVMGFSAVAWHHRDVERRLVRHRAFRRLKADLLHRMTLNWDALPPALNIEAAEDHPFAGDLDLTGPRSLHHLLDLSLTREGSRRLADWLLETSPPWKEIPQRQAAVADLVPLMARWDRLRLKLTLHGPESLDTRPLADWAARRLTLPPMSRRLAWGAGITSFNAAAFLAYKLAEVPPVWILGLIVWMTVQFFQMRALSTHFLKLLELDDSLSALRTLFAGLETLPPGHSGALAEALAPLQAAADRPSALLRKIKRVTVAIGLRANPVLSVILNLALPWDLFFARRAEQLEREVHRHFPAWLDRLHDIEALASLAALAWRHPDWAFPRIRKDLGAGIEVVALGHPLIHKTDRVCNDFQADTLGRIDLITGSNMAGKSTFLRTIGISLVLAYCGSPVCAKKMEMGRFRLFTSMRLADSLADGVSTFYAEVRRLRALLNALEADHPDPLYFFVDEIFRGTNNRERLIGSQAFLSTAAGRRCLGLVSTHDLELTRMADTLPSIVNSHFRETVEENRLVFDYTLRPGPCPTTNALIIMRAQGLPV